MFSYHLTIKKRNLRGGICSQAGYLGIGFKVLPGLMKSTTRQSPFF